MLNVTSAHFCSTRRRLSTSRKSWRPAISSRRNRLTSIPSSWKAWYLQSTSEEFQHPVPGLSCTCFMVNLRSGVVKEGVLDILVDVELNCLPVGFKLGLEFSDCLRRDRRV